MKNLKINALAILAILAISSCSKEDEPVKKVEAVNEEELITTVKIVFTPENGGTAVTLQYRDIDGDGPGTAEPQVQAIFALNKTYNGEMTILNESKSPAGNITEEVQTEAADHQLFYVKTGTLPAFAYTPAAVAPTNYDSNGKPLGLKVKFVTTTAATGDLQVILKHQGNKSAAGVADGLLTNATGATDFDVKFIGLKVQ